MAEEPRPTGGPLVQSMNDEKEEEMNLWRREEGIVNLYRQCNAVVFSGNERASSNL